MICLSQSLMGVTVPFDLRVVYKFSNKFFKEILFVRRCSFLKEKLKRGNFSLSTFPSP